MMVQQAMATSATMWWKRKKMLEEGKGDGDEEENIVTI